MEIKNKAVSTLAVVGIFVGLLLSGTSQAGAANSLQDGALCQWYKIDGATAEICRTWHACPDGEDYCGKYYSEQVVPGDALLYALLDGKRYQFRQGREYTYDHKKVAVFALCSKPYYCTDFS